MFYNGVLKLIFSFRRFLMAHKTVSLYYILHSDLQYYFEPGTGRKFRSLREVERHLNGEEYTPKSRPFTVSNHLKAISEAQTLSSVNIYFLLHLQSTPLSRKMVVSGRKVKILYSYFSRFP